MTNSRGWTLRRRVTVLCAVVGLVLSLLAVGAAAVAAQNRHYLNTLLGQTGPLSADAEALGVALVNQETGVRGFAVTGNRDDLRPYDEGVEQERTLIGRMSRLLDKRPTIRRQLRVVRDQATQWRAKVAVPVINTAATDIVAARELLDDDASERFDALRTSLKELQRLIVDLRVSVDADARRTGNILVALLAVAAVVVVLAGVALLMSLNRVVIGPVTALASQVRQVAGGEDQRKIEVVGPPELAQLARDVDGMRQRIVADLAEVRQARASVEWVNDQLQKQTEELVRSNRDLEQFAYVASHDLQEPLRKIVSFCQLLQRRYSGQLDERADQYIAFAVDGAQRMQRLINDLLAFSRVGRLTSGFTDVDLNAVMVDVVAQTEAARERTDGELTWSDLPIVRGEETLLSTLLANLVSNSFKFRRPDMPPRVHVSVRRVDDEWEITCRDNGIGIEPEFVDKIFVIFQRLHSRDAYPGTGIGLAIAKKIVEYHDGRIWADPTDADGTAIRFTLPAIMPDSGEPPATISDPRKASAIIADRPAAVVDDPPGGGIDPQPHPADGVRETVV